MSRLDRIIVALVAGAVVLALAGGYVALAPAGPGAGQAGASNGSLLVLETPAVVVAAEPATMVVDVEGAVLSPGIRELPAGSRVADAIDAAGGFAPDADLSATSTLNLAQPLVDGQQVVVPRIGDAGGQRPTPGGADVGGALVNVNTATPEELEMLPGIGSVTVQKIVAARQAQPFASLEEMVERGVIHRGQLEDIMELATAG